MRRWANAASTTANTSSRLAVVFGGSRRISETSPESTLGAGQNTFRPMAPARFTSAYQLALTDGTPYTLLPGLAASRSATSLCTITRVRSMLGKVASMCSRTGTATLYGRLATSAVGAGPGSSVTSMASLNTRSKESALPGIRAATVSGRCCASTGSISTAVTCSATSSSASVSDPRPGPTSTTASAPVTPPARTIRRTVLPSMTKFCPRCLVGFTPNAAASSRMSAAPSRWLSGVGSVVLTRQGYGRDPFARISTDGPGRVPYVSTPRPGPCSARQYPKARAVFRAMAADSSSSCSPRVAAIERTVTGIRYGALGRPR